MPRISRYTRSDIRTTLSQSDLLRFNELAGARRMKQTDLAREAIRFYLDNFQSEERSKGDAIVAHALRQSTNRICAMLSKVAIDTRAIYRFLGELEGEPERINECRAAAAKQIAQSLTAAERAVADSMSEAMKARQNENDNQA